MKEKISEEQVKHAKRIYNNHFSLAKRRGSPQATNSDWFAQQHALKTVREVVNTLVTDRAINYWKGIKRVISDIKIHKPFRP